MYRRTVVVGKRCVTIMVAVPSGQACDDLLTVVRSSLTAWRAQPLETLAAHLADRIITLGKKPGTRGATLRSVFGNLEPEKWFDVRAI